jgi:uncharacterized membrane protein
LRAFSAEELNMEDYRGSIKDSRSSYLGYLLIFVLAISIVCALILVISPAPGVHFTEFYVLGPERQADGYPTSLVAGSMSTLLVGITNHEYHKVNYTISIVIGGSLLLYRSISLDHEQNFEAPFSYRLNSTGDHQRLDVYLFKDREAIPYRQLNLYVDVVKA